MCASTNLNLIAASEYGLQPECHIYQMPQKTVIAQFSMQTTLRSSAMAFSRDGSYLLVVGSVPDFRISVYDVKAQQFLAIPETKLPFAYNKLRQVHFNPRDKHQFSILSENTIYFYTLLPAFQQGEANHSDDEEGGFELLDAYRLEQSTFSAADVPVPEEDPAVVFNSLKWDLYNRVHVCTNLRTVLQVTADEPHLEPGLELDSVPHTTLLTQKHMIVSTDDGLISWFKVEPPYLSADGKFDNSQCTKFLEVDQEYNFADQLRADSRAPASYMKYSRKHASIVIGTQNGCLATLSVPAEPLDEDEDDEEKEEKVKKQID